MSTPKRRVSPTKIEQIYECNRAAGIGPTNDHQLAVALDRDYSTLWHILYDPGRQSTRASTLKEIADALSVTVDDISFPVDDGTNEDGTNEDKTNEDKTNEDPHHIKLVPDAEDLFDSGTYQMFKDLERPSANAVLLGINRYLSYHNISFKSIRTRPSYHLFWAMHPLMSSDGIALEPDLMSREVTIDDMLQTIRDYITDPVSPESEPPEPMPDTLVGMVRQLLRQAIRRSSPPAPQSDPLHVDDLRQIVHDLNASRARRDSDGELAAVRAIFYWISAHFDLLRPYHCTYQVLNSITTIITIADPSALRLDQISTMLIIEINDHVFHSVPWFGRGSCETAADEGGVAP